MAHQYRNTRNETSGQIPLVAVGRRARGRGMCCAMYSNPPVLSLWRGGGYDGVGQAVAGNLNFAAGGVERQWNTRKAIVRQPSFSSPIPLCAQLGTYPPKIGRQVGKRRAAMCFQPQQRQGSHRQQMQCQACRTRVSEACLAGPTRLETLEGDPIELQTECAEQSAPLTSYGTATRAAQQIRKWLGPCFFLYQASWSRIAYAKPGTSFEIKMCSPRHPEEEMCDQIFSR